ncbi:hypothetical protein AYO45_05675 [Gammaproteobacteria bacterium SCGC AG-212-F23]|nr:hypothetical protein AYO45_05675 [Gammaproteobacteria bacterium SCGC AG-212-F23]
MEETSHAAPVKILLVEDDAVAAKAIKSILEEKNCTVDWVISGEELIQKLSTHYDLVILDLELPGIHGFDAAKIIRSSKGPTAGIPIIALTAYEENEKLEMARRIGINGFLTKPLSPSKCNMLLNRFVYKS